MVTIQDSLRSAKGRELVTQIAKAFGTDPTQTQAAVASLADELSVRIQRAMLSRGGVADVVSLVTSPGSTSACGSNGSHIAYRLGRRRSNPRCPDRQQTPESRNSRANGVSDWLGHRYGPKNAAGRRQLAYRRVAAPVWPGNRKSSEQHSRICRRRRKPAAYAGGHFPTSWMEKR